MNTGKVGLQKPQKTGRDGAYMTWRGRERSRYEQRRS